MAEKNESEEEDTTRARRVDSFLFCRVGAEDRERKVRYVPAFRDESNVGIHQGAQRNRPLNTALRQSRAKISRPLGVLGIIKVHGFRDSRSGHGLLFRRFSHKVKKICCRRDSVHTILRAEVGRNPFAAASEARAVRTLVPKLTHQNPSMNH